MKNTDDLAFDDVIGLYGVFSKTRGPLHVVVQTRIFEVGKGVVTLSETGSEVFSRGILEFLFDDKFA